MSTKIPQYIRGVLDPKSFSGRGTVIEYVVLETMGDCTKQKFNYKYDLYSQKLGKINVKSSLLKYADNHQFWNFIINPNGYTPDYYICVALDQYYANLLHVWEIPSKSNVVHNKGIVIRNSEKGLERFKEYEVDVSRYNDIYKTLDITQYPEFNNLDKNETSLSYLSYEWDQDPVITYFNRETGVVGTEREGHSLELDRDHYPLYDHEGVYRGYVENGTFVDICDEKFQSFLKLVLSGHPNVPSRRGKTEEISRLKVLMAKYPDVVKEGV